MSVDDQRRKEAVRALINICLLEAILLLAVVAFYLSTTQLKYLVGGVVATSLIFVPIILRWVRDHAPALRSAAVEEEEE